MDGQKSKRVLIVEDEYIGALSLAELVMSWGFDVCGTADTGEGAVLKAELEKPDVILMDISLKGEMTGIEAARQINLRIETPIVFMSGFEEDGLNELPHGGPFHFIGKPLDLDKLQRMLKEL